MFDENVLYSSSTFTTFTQTWLNNLIHKTTESPTRWKNTHKKYDHREIQTKSACERESKSCVLVRGNATVQPFSDTAVTPRPSPGRRAESLRRTGRQRSFSGQKTDISLPNILTGLALYMPSSGRVASLILYRRINIDPVKSSEFTVTLVQNRQMFIQ